MDDLISRQAAKNHLKKRLYETALNSITEHPYYEEMADNRVDVWLNELPSAERRGRWIEEYSANHFQVKCSACGKTTLYGITYDLEGNAYYMNYCPNCGARMEE